MKSRWIQLIALVICGFLGAERVIAGPLDKTFTYQGQLKDNGAPANGSYDVRFSLFDAEIAGSMVGAVKCTDHIEVINGLFNTKIRFDEAAAFGGNAQWLHIEVRRDDIPGNLTGAGCATATNFTALTPRQQITAAPYAAYALKTKTGNSLDAEDGNPQDAVFVDKDGRVGLGTTSPDRRLHVFDGSAGTSASPNVNASVVIEDRSNTYIHMLTPATSESGMLFGDDAASIRSGIIATSTQALQLRTGGNTTRVVIDEAGEVGIGIASPEAKLHVRNGDIRVDSGEVQSWGQLILHPDVDNSGDDLVRFVNGAGTETMRIHSNGNVGIGEANPQTRLHVKGRIRTEVIEITGGSDLSEKFNIRAKTGSIEAGMVVCIDPRHPGELTVSDRARDATVAGIISGAGNVQAGLTMGQEGSAADGQYPVALTGRVYAWCDSSTGSIQPGDLLTTSDTAGHAMKAVDPFASQGAILGKAMTGLESGRGLVLVLVNLQ